MNNKKPHTEVERDFRRRELRLLRPLRAADPSRVRCGGFVSASVSSFAVSGSGIFKSIVGSKHVARMRNEMKKNVPAASNAVRSGKRVSNPLLHEYEDSDQKGRGG